MKAAHKIYNRSEKGIAVNAKNDAKHNAKNNAKNNAKVQEHARVENEERIAKMSKKEAIISKAAAYFLVTKMVREPQFRLGRWCSLADILGVCPSEAVLYLLLRLHAPSARRRVPALPDDARLR